AGKARQHVVRSPDARRFSSARVGRQVGRVRRGWQVGLMRLIGRMGTSSAAKAAGRPRVRPEKLHLFVLSAAFLIAPTPTRPTCLTCGDVVAQPRDVAADVRVVAALPGEPQTVAAAGVTRDEQNILTIENRSALDPADATRRVVLIGAPS